MRGLFLLLVIGAALGAPPMQAPGSPPVSWSDPAQTVSVQP